MIRPNRRLLDVILLAMGATQTCAQEAQLPLAGPNAFQEAFSDTPTSSRATFVGATLVGVQFNPGDATFDPGKLRVHISGQPENANLCLKALSRDGKYSAQARYRLLQKAGSAPSLEFKTKYRDILTKYSSHDIALQAYVATSCNDMQGADLFVVDNGRSDQQIVAQVRAGDARLRAQLGQAGKPVSPLILCTQPAGPTVGYTAECKIPIDAIEQDGKYQLSIGETRSDGSVNVKVYPLHIIGRNERI